MKIILSIKPEFANRILEGTKAYEFRRSVFKNPRVNGVIIYASAPISKIIGEFEIEKIYYEELDMLWAQTCKSSGISKDYFTEYFDGKKKGYAIKVKNPTRYEEKLCIRESFGLVPPQSFAYVRNEVIRG